MGEGLGGRNLKPNSEALNLDAGTERMKALMSGTHGIPSGGGGCAAHVPPRCRVVMESRNRRPTGMSCSNQCTMSKKALKVIQETCFVAVCSMFQSLIKHRKNCGFVA